ncbi:MAG TPA: glycosyltransferase family 87 protein [Candidatus Dormibacteraeota bacterium]
MGAHARQARLVMAVAAALLLAYVLIWVRLPTADIDRADFTSSYVAGLLLRHQGGAAVYDLATQTTLRNALIAPVHNGAVPFVDGPPSAALVAPVTLLSLTTAYRLWSALSLLILALAVVIAVRSAPWPATTRKVWHATAGMVAMGSIGTWTLLLQGQWSSLTALGLALAYRDWRHGHEARGAVILVLAAGVAKPHLALGLAAFLVGWRQRKVIIGAVAGLAGLAVASLAVVGVSGVMAFAGLATAQGGAWDLGRMLSFIAIPGAIAGNGTASEVIGLCGTAVACVLAWALGDLARRHPERFDRALIAAAVLSLLGAPHAYAQDLVMLTPIVIWAIALAAERRLAVVGIWTLISAAAVVDLIDGGAFPPGPLAAWALIAAAVIACLAAWRPGLLKREPGTPVATRPTAAAVG